LISALEWIGVRARWVLAIGAIVALCFLQDLAAFLRPALPAFVGLMYLLAMVRIDLGAVLRRSLRPARIAMILGVCIALMVLTPALVAAIASLTALPEDLRASLVYIAAGPPLGFAAMIGIGAVLAVLLRRILGAELIERRARVFDGTGALAMLVTIVPIFDGAAELILRDPYFAAMTLMLVFALNIGMQVIATPILRRVSGLESGGAMGLIWGNRNAALYLAALPQSPVFSLFVALYQFPMYMTPLLMRRFYSTK